MSEAENQTAGKPRIAAVYLTTHLVFSDGKSVGVGLPPETVPSANILPRLEVISMLREQLSLVTDTIAEHGLDGLYAVAAAEADSRGAANLERAQAVCDKQVAAAAGDDDGQDSGSCEDSEQCGSGGLESDACPGGEPPTV